MKVAIAKLLANRANAREIADVNVQDAARKYITWSPNTAPPILVRESDLWVLNGHNRLAAAILRGETEIEATYPTPVFMNEKDRKAWEARNV